MPERMLAALDTLPSRTEPLKEPIPFLMPMEGDSGGDEEEEAETHMVLPPEKENRKIRFQEEILVTEIENRFYLNDFPEDDDEGSYEIEIVEDDGDADFYLEIVDGEVFYVFETEDDISLDSEDDLIPDGDGQKGSGGEEDITNQFNSSMFINVDDMMLAPDLEESEGAKDSGPPMEISIEPDTNTMESFNQASQFLELDNFLESSDEEDEDVPLTHQQEESPPMPFELNFELEEAESSATHGPVETGDAPIMDDEVESKPEHDKVAPETTVDEVPVPAPVTEKEPIAAATKKTPTLAAVETPKSPEKDNVNARVESSRAPVSRQHSTTSEPESPSSTVRSYQADSTASQGSKTKSILRSNPASPIKAPKKEPKRDRSKKKTAKTFSKTYVRADQLDGEHRVYAWAKPDWTKERKLRETGRADLLRKGKLEAPITFFPKKPVNEGLQQEDENMEDLLKKAMNAANKSVSIFGTKKTLKVSLNGSKLREGQDIVKPITQAPMLRKAENVNKVANPGVLKPTQTGEVVRKGGTLAAPVTFPKKKEDGTNPVANQNVLRNKGLAPQPRKQYEWSKPDWTKGSKLRHTEVGQAVKQGADLQVPITQAPHRRKSFDTQSYSSSGSSEGAKSDEAVVAPRRGGRRHVPDRTTSMPSSSRSQASSGGLSGLSCSSRDSDDIPETTTYEKEKLRKEREQAERQARLARMARAWAEENH